MSTTSQLKARTCCLTGHRELPALRLQEIEEKTKRAARTLILQNAVRFFGIGGAVGYDTLAAKALFELREREFPHIRVILVYPYDGFTRCWPQEQREEYAKRLPLYDKVVCACDTGSRQAYLTRDRRLVDGSAYCIGYCTRSSGGTAYTLRYAREKGLEVYNIGKEDAPPFLTRGRL